MKSLLPALRKIVYALVPAAVLLVLLELVSLHHYFRDLRPEPLGLHAAVNDLRLALLERFDPESVVKAGLPPNVVIFEQLYGESGRKLLGEFEAEYEALYLELAREVERLGASLVLVYIPPTIEHSMAEQVGGHDSRFFARLAARTGAEYLDLAESFSRHSKEELALLPEDLHLSRFGNRVLAEAVAEKLRPLGGHRSAVRFDQRPALLGDLPPGSRRIWQDVAHPFRVTINAQGLRMAQEVEFPKTRQRILLLGDSFTFGYNVHDASTFPLFLSRLLPDREFINAGVPGYNIVQQLPMFMERARYVEPDIVVLQVLFNDLFGMFSFEQNIFSRDPSTRGFWLGKRIRGREKLTFQPSPLEELFVAELRRDFPQP